MAPVVLSPLTRPNAAQPTVTPWCTWTASTSAPTPTCSTNCPTTPSKTLTRSHPWFATTFLWWCRPSPNTKAWATSAVALLQSGKVRFLAAAAPKRIAGYDKGATAAESGGPTQWAVGGWNGLLVPKGTPKEGVARLNDSVTKAMQSPEVKDKLGPFTYEAYTMSPQDMAKQMEAEVAQWGPTLQKAGI